jgi:hypothetical protein
LAVTDNYRIPEYGGYITLPHSRYSRIRTSGTPVPCIPTHMKSILFYFLLFLCAFTSFGQCPVTDLVLTTQTEVDAFPTDFPGCSALPVNLRISSGPTDQITDLSPLSQLNSIDGDLIVDVNPLLTILAGLDNVASVGGNFRLSSNDVLLNVIGLTNLATVGGDFEISNNTALTGVEPLSDLTAIGGELRIQSNAALTNLTGLDNINESTISHLVLESSPLLTFCNVPSICSYLIDPGNTFSIFGNAPGCADDSQISVACIGPLPVDMMDFTGTPIETSTVLSWKTIGETNNTGFEVQRSRDMLNWEKLDFVPGGGNTFEETIYTFTDIAPFNGIAYYRLRQIDISGMSILWDPISVERSIKEKSALYPNPTTGITYLAESGDLPVAITDQQGRELKTVTGPEIDLSELPQGVYFLCMTENNAPVRIRIVKE